MLNFSNTNTSKYFSSGRLSIHLSACIWACPVVCPVQDLALDLSELQEIHMGPPLKPVKVPLMPSPLSSMSATPNRLVVSANCMIIKKWSIKKPAYKPLCLRPAPQVEVRPVFCACFKTKQPADLQKGSCPSFPNLPSQCQCQMLHTKGSVQPVPGLSRLSCQTKRLWFPEHTHFYTSPTVFVKPRICWYARLGTTTRNKVEVSDFFATNNSHRKAVMFLFVYMHMSMYGLQCICEEPSAITPCWEQQLLCNSSNLIERKQW